eukprot:462662_1
MEKFVKRYPQLAEGKAYSYKLLDVLGMITLLFPITRSKENQAVAVQAGCWSVLLDIALHSSQQAGSEVSALLGNIPSAVGYQPTLATEMGELQE